MNMMRVVLVLFTENAFKIYDWNEFYRYDDDDEYIANYLNLYKMILISFQLHWFGVQFNLLML